MAELPIAPIPAMDDLLVRLRDIKKVIKDAEEQRVGKQLDGVECQLADLMKEWKVNTASVVVEGVKITGTLVEGTTLHIDTDRLQKALGSKLWMSVTSRVLDKAKLEDAIARNVVDPAIVAQCSMETPKRAYITIAEKIVERMRGRRR